MSATAFYSSLLIVWLVLYVALPVWLLKRGWLLRAGLAQLLGAIIPGIWQGIFWPDERATWHLS